MPAHEIIPGVWWVGGGSWGNTTEIISADGSGNVFLIGGDNDFALIDAGIQQAADAVIANCKSIGVDPKNISRIFITHPHGDHFQGAPRLKELTDASIIGADLNSTRLPSDSRARTILGITESGAYETFSLDEKISDGAGFNIGPFSVESIDVPGHIPASIALVADIHGTVVMFTGDSAIGDQGGRKGVVGWLDGHWHSNPKHLLHSINKMLDVRADILLPGHGYPVTGAAAVRISLDHCAERVKMLLDIPSLNTMMPLDLSD